MKKSLLIVTVTMLLSASSALAAAKTYQVTGPVLELSDKAIVIQKGTEKWQLLRDANTKLPPEVKVGSKVTAYYSMTATEIEDKTPKAKEAAPAKDAKKAK